MQDLTEINPQPITITFSPYDINVLLALMSRVGGSIEGPRNVADELLNIFETYGYVRETGLYNVRGSIDINVKE